MKEDEALNLECGDVFKFPDFYKNSEMRIVKHNYKCTILSVIIDDDARQGFTIKRYLKTRNHYVYEFFDIFKVIDRCEL